MIFWLSTNDILPTDKQTVIALVPYTNDGEKNGYCLCVTRFIAECHRAERGGLWRTNKFIYSRNEAEVYYPDKWASLDNALLSPWRDATLLPLNAQVLLQDPHGNLFGTYMEGTPMNPRFVCRNTNMRLFPEKGWSFCDASEDCCVSRRMSP